MKNIFFSVFILLSFTGVAQNFQFHYDFRHSINPDLNSKNFPTINFEYFKNLDTIGTGSFLLKLQTDFNGTGNNVGQVFTQVLQTLKFWKPPVYIALNYTGGLGVTPDSYGYYISNSFGLGIAYPFKWKGAWFNTNLLFRYTTFDAPSCDPQFTFYYGKGFLNYRIFITGSFVLWTENRNRGDDYTKDLNGKKLVIIGDPQIWIKIIKGFSLGSRINVFYNLLDDNNQIKVYPTIGAKYDF